jgi:hypothetical protein
VARFHLLVALGLVVSTSLASTQVARAQVPEGFPSEDAPPTRTPVAFGDRWYGWETLLVDAGAFGIFAAGIRLGSEGIAGTGALVYGAGPPVIHGLRGHAEMGAVDLMVRVFAPITLGAAGFAIDEASSPPCSPTAFVCIRGLGGAAVGILAGYVGAVVLDAGFLAWDSAPKHEKPSAVLWSPTVSVAHGGGSLGVGGAF